MIVGLLGLGVTLAGCGPSALEQRVCEMWGDEGGKFYAESQATAWVQLETVRRAAYWTERSESRARGEWVSLMLKESAARERVSHRLSLSLREVNEALKKCPGAETQIEREQARRSGTRLERDIAEAERKLKGK